MLQFRSICRGFAIVFAAGCTGFGLNGLALAQATASIQGKVEARDGTPIGGANITYGLLAAPAGRATAAMLPPVGQLFSTSDGSFSIQNLKAGEYLVCVSAMNQPYLDPCHWSTTPSTFTVGNGQAITNAIIQLSKGQQYQIRINDPQQNFAFQGKSPGANLAITYRSPSGAVHSAVLASSDSTGRNYIVTIPVNTPITLYVAPGAFQLLNNALGSAVASTGSQYQITASSASPASTLTFTLTGIGKP